MLFNIYASNNVVSYVWVGIKNSFTFCFSQSYIAGALDTRNRKLA